MQYLFFGLTGFAGELPVFPSGVIEIDFAYAWIDGGLSNDKFTNSPNIEYINLKGNAFNATVPSIFSTFPNLHYLYIDDCFISGDLSYMEGMPAIYEHWIDANPDFGGTIPAFISDLSTLHSFSVTQSALVGTIPSHLGLMTHMRQMWFYDNQLTGTIPTELGALSRMSIFQVEGNKFTGSVPTQVCDNTNPLLGYLTILGADCDDTGFTCSCCTCCSLLECNPSAYA